MANSLRIKNKFNELKIRDQKALITYITAGDPTMEITEKLVLKMEEAGADIIELGVPYSDPLADGPVIQRASERALAQKTKMDDVFAMTKTIRTKTQIPLALLIYYNPIFRYGLERFLKECQIAGVDGLIIPDLPLEERGEIKELLKAKGYEVDLIPLVALTSQERVEKIVEEASGFVYCVSSKGVTGQRKDFDEGLKPLIDAVKKQTHIPTAIGFGISTPEAVKDLRELADGIIVGSAIVKVIEEGIEQGDIENKVYSFVKSLREALDE